MTNIFKIFCFISLISLSACNTMGGLGKDVSEAGKALDDAASWSQDQINTATNDTDNQVTGNSEEIFQ